MIGFPANWDPSGPGTVPDHPLFQVEDDLRDLLVGEGFLEAQTMAFAPEAEGEVELSNPVSMQEAHLRTALLPGLVRRVEFNFARGMRDIRLFELGTVFLPGESGRAPREEAHLALVLTGDQAPLHWKGEPKGVDLWYLKGLLGRLIPGARMEGARVTEGAPRGQRLVPEEGFTVVGADGEPLGSAGRIDPARVDAPAWAGPVWGLELTLPSEPNPRRGPSVRGSAGLSRCRSGSGPSPSQGASGSPG